MQTRQFVEKTIKKIIILFIVILFLISVLRAGATIVSNELALTQFENSDGWYIAQEVYNTAVRPTITTIIFAIISFNVGAISYDTYKFIKEKRK